MKVLCLGGGSGGHVTPVRAVIDALADQVSRGLEVRFVCDRKFAKQARGIMSHARISVPVTTVFAGKLRRYKGFKWWWYLVHPSVIARNLWDLVMVALGLAQSFWILLRWRPDVVFAKGGYVCLPVGLVAHWLGVPLVIHDSDVRPGLTNRILARFAVRIATGAPVEYYPYPKSRTTEVGVPADEGFRPYGAQEQMRAKDDLGLVDLRKPLVVVTGGGLGSESLNNIVLACADSLLDDGFVIYHITGQKHYRTIAELAPDSVDYVVTPFVHQAMNDVLGAADVVVSRAGATALLELALLKKPAIIVPAPHLGDQAKNSARYAQAGAVVQFDEDKLVAKPALLAAAIGKLAFDKKLAQAYSERIAKFAKPRAASDVAGMIIAVAKTTRGRK